MNRLVVLLVLISFQAAHCQNAASTVPKEPTNLDLVKKQLTHYHDCSDTDCYYPQIERQTELAIGYLRSSVAKAQQTDRLALVLDIDETSLSNWSVEQHDDFGYIPTDSDWCIELRCGKAIPGTLRLYREALKNHVLVFFISGRPQSQQAATEGNLKTEGYDRFERVFLRPVNHRKDETVADFKSTERAAIIRMGFKLILNVGDQFSDLSGATQAEHSVKLPNPFYFIP